MLYEMAALAAATCWAATGLLSAGPAARLGPFGFNLYRQAFVTVLLALFVVLTGRWHGMPPGALPTLALSGLIGIFVGDSLLYVALIRLGPRRSGALFALNAPIAALLGWGFLDETLSARAWLGVVLCTLGVGVCVLGRPGRSGTHRFEQVQGRIWIGAGFGLLAATGQALGSLIARPVMAQGFDPALASLIRVAVAVAGLAVLAALPTQRFRAAGTLTRTVALQTMASGIIAMVFGMTLLMFALQGGKVGIVSTLSALSPVMILPLLWGLTGSRPSAASLMGALVAVAGMALIFLR